MAQQRDPPFWMIWIPPLTRLGRVRFYQQILVKNYFFFHTQANKKNSIHSDQNLQQGKLRRMLLKNLLVFD